MMPMPMPGRRRRGWCWATLWLLHHYHHHHCLLAATAYTNIVPLPSSHHHQVVSKSTAPRTTRRPTLMRLDAKGTSSSKKAARRENGAGGFGTIATTPSSSSGGGENNAIHNNKNGANNKLRSIGGSKTPGAGSKVLRQAALAFDRIRTEHGISACADVYVRSPLDSPTTYWFVGKVAFDITTTPAATTVEQACLCQKRIILEYAQHELRPRNMGGKLAAALEIWWTPPDSEMDIVRNLHVLTKISGNAVDHLPNDFRVDYAGYNPEIYVGEERVDGGLRVERDEWGRPTKPVFDVQPPKAVPASPEQS